MANGGGVNREGDLVLIYYQDRPTLYARIEAIEPDIKKDWYQVTLLVLTIPAQIITWILREEYIQGGSFTMGGQPVRLEKVSPAIQERKPEEGPTGLVLKQKQKPAKVIPFKNNPKESEKI
ncbi:MAG: hypothetical protein JRI79_09610 [Deltaproteobacteria bacterium]|nr:hypothetical protein [Deltaproteobacteria bacterium]MBW1936936.1 hypothetical protein [Deltaproteobacteria bacterium]MBW1978204.1 hypothetical protein [Deltaproteobacteria bacterium]MBW2044561.1 hypothetical protein [Deltaproteobacteria bacterium]MBW2300328.1 hypothetical protein [Deltaproteobacteria bacterium]